MRVCPCSGFGSHFESSMPRRVRINVAVRSTPVQCSTPPFPPTVVSHLAPGNHAACHVAFPQFHANAAEYLSKAGIISKRQQLLMHLATLLMFPLAGTSSSRPGEPRLGLYTAFTARARAPHHASPVLINTSHVHLCQQSCLENAKRVSGPSLNCSNLSYIKAGSPRLPLPPHPTPLLS